MRTARVITASNRASAGVYEDRSGDILRAGLIELGYETAPTVVVPDDVAQIQAALRDALADGIDLIVTTGGTGISPTDVTPEATAPVLERQLPGIPEALRAAARAAVPTADLSRGLAGVTGSSLIINLPGSPGAVRDGLAVIQSVAGHALDQVAGGDHIASQQG